MIKRPAKPKIGFSTGCFIGVPLADALNHCMRLQELTGASVIEIGMYPDMMDAGYPSTPWPWLDSPEWKVLIPFLRQFDLAGAHFSLSDFNIVSGNPLIKKASIDLIVESINRCVSMGIVYGVLHIRGDRYGIPGNDQRHLIVDTIQTMMAKADAAGFTLCLENASLNSRSIVILDHLFSVVEAVQSDRVKLLVDVGHTNLPWLNDSGKPESVFGKCGDLAGFLSLAGEEIFGFHVHANNGRSDEHLPISGTPFDLNPLGLFTSNGSEAFYIIESIYQQNIDLAAKDYHFLEEFINNSIG